MSTIAIIGRMLVALVIVLAVMWLLAKWARRPLGVGRNDKVMNVLARQQLSRSTSVAVLKLMDRALVLGVSEQGVQLLAETELAPLEQALVVEPGPRRSRAVARRPEQLTAGEPAEVLEAGATGPARSSALDGSILAPGTWKQLVHAARELTVRR